MSERDDYIRLLWDEGALLLRDQSFELKSGRRSHVYANHRSLLLVPEFLRLMATLLVTEAGRLRRRFALCSIDSFSSPFLVAAASAALDVPAYALRAANREKGIEKNVFRYVDNSSHAMNNPDLPAVLVDDVVTTASTMSWARLSLNDAGIESAAMVCLLDRRTRSDQEDLADWPIVGVTTLAEVLAFGRKEGKVPDSQRRLVDDELMALER